VTVPARPILVVMGVSGSGKTTLGQALADRLGAAFQEGDDLHPPANIAKMRAGEPLDDADRAPWLDRVADWLGARAAAGEAGVASCSALRRRYRDRLRLAVPDLAFVFPDPPEEVLRRRIMGRSGHFIPIALLDSQLAALERPGTDERVLRLQEDEDIETQCDRVCAWLAAANDQVGLSKQAP
jgi:gluconokinase